MGDFQATNIKYDGDIEALVKRINQAIDELYVAIEDVDSSDKETKTVFQSKTLYHPYKGKTNLRIRAKCITVGSVINVSNIPDSTIFENDGDGVLYFKDRDGTIIEIGASGGGGVTDHGALTGLEDDDHTQYLDSTRHALIGGNPHGVTKTEVGLGNVLNVDTTNADNISDGVTNAIITLTQETNFESAYTHSLLVSGNPHNVTLSDVGGTTDHSLLDNLGSDDHTQYHNDARGDARYLQLTGGTISGNIFNFVESGENEGFYLYEFGSSNNSSFICVNPAGGDSYGTLTLHNEAGSGIVLNPVSGCSLPSLSVLNNITVGGTVDGRDVDLDGTNQDNHIADSTIHFTESSIDHTNISNIGTNTHSQIDTHISSTSNPHSVTLDQATDAGSTTTNAITTGQHTINGNLIVDTNVLFVDSINNKVGIGDTAPAKALTISGSGDDFSSIKINRTDTSSVFIIGYNYIGTFSNTFLRFFANSSERIRIATNGNVGIGTTTPGSKLSVVGLPTSSTGLSTGDIWIDTGAGNVLKIV